MNDERFEQFLKEAAREYHEPPETPRERMWSRIEAERRRGSWRGPGRLGSPWLRWGLGLAAALAIGIGIGRSGLREAVEPTDRVADSGALNGERASGTPGAVPRASGTSGSTADLVYRALTTQHLTRAEALLTSFRADPGGMGDVEREFRTQADDLLTSTWLLLDSPAGRDPAVRALLEDIEFVLLQIRQLTGREGDSEEIDLVTDGLRQRQLLFRLRATIPPGVEAGPRTGAL